MHQPNANGLVAYRRSTTPRQMEAQVFSRVARQLRAAVEPVDRIRAKADASRLWGTVLDCVVATDNQLPSSLRAQIAGLARAVERECASEEPDLGFIADVTENVAAGLWS